MRINSRASALDERRSGNRTAVEAVLFVGSIVVVWLIPIVAVLAWLGLMAAREQSAVERPGPPSFTVGRTTDVAAVPVTVTVTVRPGDALRSRMAGVVTAVSSDQSGAIASGRYLLSINDIAIRAQVGPSPIVHSVGPESSGADVERVAQLLTATGYLSEATGVEYTWDLRLAIDHWNEDAGLWADGVFDVGSVLFVPEDAAPLEGFDVRVGDEVAPGAQVGALSASVVAVEFSAATDVPLTALSGVPVTVQFGDAGFPLDERDAPPSPELLAFLDAAVSDGSATYTPGDNSGVYEGGQLQLSEAREYATVPTSAVYVASNGMPCVFMWGENGRATSRSVPDARPIGASGVTAVGVALAGDTVVSNVSVLPPDVISTCG